MKHLLLLLLLATFTLSAFAVECENLTPTTGIYGENDDLDQAVKSELGTDYTVADWNDLKALPDIDAWISCMGLTDIASFNVLRNGQQVSSGTRQYFVRYAPSGSVASTFLVHDQIGSYIYLGSWTGDRLVLAKNESGNTNEGGLIAHYPFNGNADDESGNSYDASIVGPELTNDRFGNENAAFFFDGDQDYIQANTKLPINSFPMSISVWINPSTFSSDRINYIYVSDDWDHHWGSYRGFCISVRNEGFISANYGSGINTSANYFQTEANTIVLNQWQHVVVNFNGPGDVDIYIDGTKMTTTETTPGNDVVSFSSAKDRIGYAYDGLNRHSFHGKLDDISIYDKPLSETEISDLYGLDSDLESSIDIAFDLIEFGKSESKYLQNQAVIEVELIANRDLSEIAISGEFDGQPMDIHLYESLDSNDDLVIDQIKKDFPYNINFSSKPFSTNQLSKNVKISITSISGESVNKTIEEDVSIYFAKSANEQNRPFNSNPDYYAFENQGQITLQELRHEFSLNFYNPLLMILKTLSVWNGRCFGMSATAGAYFKNPGIKPLPGYPWEWGVDPKQVVLSNINTYQFSQVLYKPSFDDDPAIVYNAIKEEITKGNPIMIGMESPGGGKHAVLATKITEFSNSETSRIHVYNTWDVDWLDEISYNAGTNKFGWFDNSYNKFCIFPQSAFNYYSTEVLLNQYYGHTSSFLDLLQQKVFAIACPVNMYVINEFGQRAGFISDGTKVNEISGSAISRIASGSLDGDSITYIYVPVDGNYNVVMTATDTGNARFEYYEPVSQDEFFAVTSDSIQLNENTSLSFNDASTSTIDIDDNRDGQIDRSESTYEFSNTSSGISRNIYEELVISPNPFYSRTTIRFESQYDTPDRILIRDLSGRIVRQFENISQHEYILNREDLADGVYIIEAQGAKTYIGKIIIQ